MKRPLFGVVFGLAVVGSLLIASDRSRGFLLMAPSSGGGGGAVWNVADKDASITITTTTTTSDTATGTVGSGFKTVRATAPGYTVGTNHKVVVRFDIVTASSNASGANDALGTLVGLDTAAVPVSGHLAAANYGYAVEGGTGGDYQNGVGTTVSPPACGGNTPGLHFHGGDSLWLAIDFNSGNVFCSPTCTSWQGGGTPDSGAPSAVLTAGTGPYFLAWSGANFNTPTPDKVILNAAPPLGSPCVGLTTYHTWNAG